MLQGVAHLCLMLGLAQAGTEDPPPATPAATGPAAASKGAPEAAAPPAAQENAGAAGATARFEFESFGKSRPLARADRVVAVRAESVSNVVGIATSVVRCAVLESFLPVDERRPPATLVVLAAQGEFRPETEYLVFLERFRGGDRYVALARIASGDRDFAGKRRVLKVFAALDRLSSEPERNARIRDALLRHLDDPDSFVRWNAIAEWQAFARFAKDRPDLVGPEHRAALVKRLREERGISAREALAGILKTLGVDPAVAASESTTSKDP